MSETDLQSLAGEVRYLRDRFDIIDAIHRYIRGIDRLDAPLLESAYHPDAIDDRGPFTGSPSEFVAWVFPHVGGAAGTAHNISNITCEIDGDGAHTETYVTFAVWSKDGKKVTMGGARYLDRLERRKGQWGIVRRETMMDYVFEAPANALPDAMPKGVRDHTDRSYLRPLDLTDAARQRLKEKAEAVAAK
jgi:hypothetical protein